MDAALLLVAAALWLNAAAGQQSVLLNAGHPYAVRSYRADLGDRSTNRFGTTSSYAWVGTGRSTDSGVLYSFSDEDVNKFVRC